MRLRVRGLNFTLPRRIDGKPVRVPVIAGLKIGLTGEMYLLDLMHQLLPHIEGAIVDVGANIGQTLSKAKLAAPDRPYYGFEPNPACFHYLEAFIEANQWQRIALFPFGIAQSVSVLSLHTSSDKSTDSEATFLPDANPHHSAGRARHAVVLDYAAIEPLIKEPIAMLKIDVEGMELDIVKALTRAIEQDQPVIALEMLNLANLEARHTETVRLLQTLGYQVFFIETNKARRLTGLKRIDAYTDFGQALKADYLALTPSQTRLLDASLIH